MAKDLNARLSDGLRTHILVSLPHAEAEQLYTLLQDQFGFELQTDVKKRRYHRADGSRTAEV